MCELVLTHKHLLSDTLDLMRLLDCYVYLMHTMNILVDTLRDG